MRTLLHLLLAASAVLNFLLWRTTTEQAWQIEALVRPIRLVPGDRLPDLSLVDENREAVEIRFSEAEQDTILYLTSSTCAWCDANAARIRELAQKVGARYRFVGISLQDDVADLRAYGQKLRLPFQLLTGLTDEAALALKVRSTPTTVVVGADNHVKAIWDSAFGGPTAESIQAFFGLEFDSPLPMRAEPSS